MNNSDKRNCDLSNISKKSNVIWYVVMTFGVLLLTLGITMSNVFLFFVSLFMILMPTIPASGNLVHNEWYDLVQWRKKQ